MKSTVRAIPVSFKKCMQGFLFCLIVFTTTLSFAQAPSANWSHEFDGNKSFIENKGQFDDRDKIPGSEIEYAVDHGDMQIYFTREGVTYRFEKREKNPNRRKGDRTKPKQIRSWEFVRFNWEGASAEAELTGLGMMQDYHTYSFYTTDRSSAYTIDNVRGYKKLVYQNLYPKIDVEYTFHPQGGIKYSVILHPGADPSLVKMKYVDGTNFSMDRTGKIIIPTFLGNVIEHAPITFYAGNTSSMISSRFVKEENVISFQLGNYNSTRAVVIDPWVQTPALANSNGVWECEKDGLGNVYIIGGDSPMKLLKYSPTGILQWTYNTPWDTLNNWLGTFATDLAGNSYVTSGSIADMQKVNTGGGLVWSAAGGFLDEYWSIAFNCDQTKLVVGGTRLGIFPPAGSHGVIFDINTVNGSVTNLVNVASLVPRPLISDINEVRAITSSRNAKYYYLTLDTIGAINQNLSACSSVPLFSINSTYNFAYKGENYRPSNGNSGICAIRANDQFVYTQNGAAVHKRSPSTGAIITSATIPGGISVAVPFFGTNQAGNSGIDLDDCGNVYVGSGDRVIKYDANLNLITSVALPFRVYDVTVSYNGEIIVAGATGNNSIANRTGYVQVINMAACTPFSLICCDATVCPTGPYCTSDAPFSLIPVQAGGTWSGPGITNPTTGIFNPAAAGVGTHDIVYSLSCGGDTVTITVNSCAALAVCVESNGQYTVSGGTGPYTWESGAPFQNCTACPFGICFPVICPGFPDTTWTTFATGVTVTPPGTFPIRVRDSGVNSLQIDTSLGLPSCGPICPTINVNIANQRNVTCFRFNDGSATVAASGGLAPYSYIWQPGGLIGATQNNLAAGVYTITASDVNRCTGTGTVTITSPSEIIPNPSQTNATCAGNDGTASVLPSGGTPSYRYSWSNAATTPSISGLQAGTYTVTINDANSCSVTTSFIITSPQDAFSSQDVSICDGESFFAGGGFQTVSGTYYDTLVAAGGCDSIVTTNLTVLPALSFIQDISICDGDSFFVGGAFQKIAGSYYDSLVSTIGCDSIVTTNLTVQQNISENVDVSICDGDAYFAGGEFQTTTGTYYDTLVATGGCDSIVITNLTVLPNYTINQDVSICDGESYFAGGGNQTTSGIYYDSLLASTGCDSVLVTNLTVLPRSSATQNASICDGDSLFAGGAFQTTSGTYLDTLVGANGCDSIVTTNLTVLQNVSETVNASICDGDGFFAGGDFQTATGTYYDTLTASAGCDSIVITNLTVLPNYSDTLDVSICDGQSYFAGGANQTTSGTYYDSLLASTGCDSVLITHLTVLPALVTNQDVRICDGDSLFVGGGFQTGSGIYSDTLATSGGCDSIVVTNLSVLTDVSDSVDVSICDGESYFAGGAFQTTAGTYYDTLTASEGCDSIVVTNLTVLPPVVAAFTASSNTICLAQSISFTNGSTNASSYRWDFGDGNTSTNPDPIHTYASTGIFTVTLEATNSNGCENSVSSNITVGTESLTVLDASICDGESYFAGGGFQTETGVYFDTLVAASGCDSIVSTNLTVIPVSFITLDPVICNGDGYFAGGAVQTTSGTYYDTLTTVNGCDSIITTNLTVLGTAALTVSNDTAICPGSSVQLNASGGLFTYEWSPVSGLSNPDIANPIAAPLQTTTYIVTTQVASDEQIINGDFSAGITGFTSGYSPSTNLFPEGTYYVGSNPNVFHSGFASCGDHTSGFGNMMIVNGSSTAGVNIWCQTINVIPNTDYAFSCWVTSVVASSPAILQFSINGNLLGSPFTATSTVCSWQQFYSIWNSGSNTTADICIVNQNTALSGNDFALDDISFTGLCSASDTVTITVLNVATTMVDAAICDGESYFSGGEFQTQAGTYFDTLTTANSCDSIITTNLMVLPHSSLVLDASICDGESYFAGGGFQTTAGVYYDTLTAANGCDSVVTINLIVLPHSSTVLDASICAGESYFAGGGFQTQAGTYLDTLTAANDCDSIVTTNLIVLPHSSLVLDATICDGESYFTGGGFQTQTGTYFDTLIAANGCDSVVTTNLTVLPHSTMVIDASICNGESYFAGGTFQTEKGTYFDTLVAANGCDSVVVTNLDVLPNPFSTQSVSICDGESYFVGGGDQTTSGIYYDTLVAANGCDSIVETTLTILLHSFTTIDASICDGESYFAGGGFQTETGTYLDTLVAANGCDSIVTTNLTVYPNASTTIDTTICDGSGYFAEGAIQTTSGTYYDTLTTSFGCDSVIITNLTFSTSMGFTFNITDASCNGLCDGAAECTVSGGQEPLAFNWSNGATAALNDNLCADTYGITATDANGCTAESFATVGEPDSLTATISHRNISCNCTNPFAIQDICVIDFAGLPAGTILDEQYAAFGIHISGDVHSSSSLDKLIVFNSNATGTPDPDLEAGIGNLAILPQNLIDANGDGLVDAPNDNNFGGKQIYTFDSSRDIISFIFVDMESSSATAIAYDAQGNVIKSISIPAGGNGSVQTVMLNAQGVSMLVIEYHFDSGGVTQITFGCTFQCCDAEASCEASGGTPPYSFAWSNGSTQQALTGLCAGNYEATVTDDNGCQFSTSVSIAEFEGIEVTVTSEDVTSNCAPANQLCELDFGGLPSGIILNEQYAQFGIHISGDAYSSFPDQIIIFNADATNTPDPDLEPATGHLAIFPERLNDNNSDGLVDIPNDQGAGGKMTFTFDQEREVISFVFADKDNNNPSFAKAYDASNNLIKTVNIPNRGDGSIQTVVVNATGVRKLVIDYRGSGGVTNIVFGCTVICCDGSASVSVSGGTPPFTYQWSNGVSTTSIDSLCAGTYTVTVTDAEGCVSEETIVIGDCHLSITGMMLVRDGFSADIAPLNDGGVISLDTLCPFNIRAILCQSPIGSIKYKINGVHFRTEEYEPYALAGDNPTGNYHPWIPQPGDYTVEATPYSGFNATGTAGSPFTIHFTIMDEPCAAFKATAGNISTDAFDVTAYPIPFDEKIMIDVTSASASTAVLKVTDMLGVEVVKQHVGLIEGMNTITIASNNWMPDAIYFLEVQVNEQMKVMKLIKMK